MGMYTGLRVKCKVKPEFREVIKKVIFDEFDEDGEWLHERGWKSTAKLFPQYEFLKNWSEVGRASFIPWGAVCYLPWENENDYNPETGQWSFTCSLKNYEEEIEIFLRTVLAEIAEELYRCEVRYEEWRESMFYSLSSLKDI